ncbi:MAG TPA: peroxiredoxin [Actinomycetales bacterium]|nr:peroxiredoxin [Actinomycetales bacterium]
MSCPVTPVHDPDTLPPGLPRPVDDGGAAHLPGATLPHVALTDTDGQHVDLAALAGRSVVYAYPRTGRPGQAPLVDDWDAIPGARGCTPESCAFRDHHAELTELGVRVLGLSTQSTADQAEAVERLHLPFPLLSDDRHRLTDGLRLPTFDVAGQRLLRRLTLLVADGAIEHVWYPVFPPDAHAGEVVAWLRDHPEGEPAGRG